MDEAMMSRLLPCLLIAAGVRCLVAGAGGIQFREGSIKRPKRVAKVCGKL